MTKIRQRKYLLAIAALVLVFGGCKGESPTAPPITPGGGAGGVTPPTSATLDLSISNPTPLVDSTTVVTAKVQIDGKDAANGTAVEFKTTLGTFTDANAAITIRTTTGGIATATLTSSTAGTATVTATVANVSKTVQATFSLKPTTPQPPDTAPTITSITPTQGRPQGGEIITITGKNFVPPMRVIFDYGSGVTKEAQVISATSTEVQAITPAVDLGTGQTKDATIILINNVGSPNEARITGSKFTYQAEVLTPKITTLSPTSGPIDGGTRVTIFGEGFQAPMQVFFGAAEATIINITFNQIIVMSPTARDTSDDGSLPVTGFVPLKVININSATTVTLPDAFRYTPAMVITAITPNLGSAIGGTQVRIDGIGFNEPVTVDIGEAGAAVRAQVLKVSSTQIIISTGALPSPCGIFSGAVIVTNVDNGAVAKSEQIFSYLPVDPIITSVTSGASPITLGSPVTITVRDPGVGPLGNAFVAFMAASTPLKGVTPFEITQGTGTQTFAATLPLSGLTFPAGTAADTCTVAGLTGTLAFGPLIAPITFSNLTTGCTATLTDAITIQPPAATNTCTVTPTPVVAPAPGTCVTPAAASVALNQTTTGTITITNPTVAGAAVKDLVVSAATVSGANASEFTVSPTTATIKGGNSQGFTVSFKPTSVGAKSATITFTTSAGNINVCATSTGNP